MPFGLLKSLFGAPNPTRDWPPSDGVLPPINAHTYAFGTLRFGDPLDAAMFLGRPDKYTVSKQNPDWVTLDYFGGAVQVYFSAGEFDTLSLHIGVGGEFKYKESDPAVEPTLSSGEKLTRQTTRAELEEIFGAPHDVYDPSTDLEPEEIGDEGVTLDYNFSPVLMDFEFNRQDRLVAWSLHRDVKR